mmetsp:Transcript_36423/g.117671  ORF Transcript_36423/g.117671 Transcript_36423/m.117671 type:complete len:201 (-) Transcript_36423:207-809(-)
MTLYTCGILFFIYVFDTANQSSNTYCGSVRAASARTARPRVNHLPPKSSKPSRRPESAWVVLRLSARTPLLQPPAPPHSSRRPFGFRSEHVGHSQCVVLPARRTIVSSGRSASISTPSSSKWMTKRSSSAAGRCSTTTAGYHCERPSSSRKVALTKRPTRDASHCAGHATASDRPPSRCRSLTRPCAGSGSQVSATMGGM